MSSFHRNPFAGNFWNSSSGVLIVVKRHKFACKSAYKFITKNTLPKVFSSQLMVNFAE